MIYIFPLLISWAQGYFLLRLLFPAVRPSALWHLFIAGLLGLGISAEVAFTSFLFFDQLIVAYVIAINIILMAGLGSLAFLRSSKRNPLSPIPSMDRFSWIAIGVVALMTIPVIIHARLFPYGGWDAWSCWNLKARFLYLGGSDWSQMFDPILWGSNLNYPLLLPLINVWLWCFKTMPDPNGPLVITCLITFLTAGALAATLKELTGKSWSLIAPVWLLSILFIVKLASSQYSDLLVGAFLLTAISSFCLYEKSRDPGFLKLALIAAGFMSFTKSEGLVLSLLTLFVIGTAIIIHKADRATLRFQTVGLLATAVISFLITGIFLFLFTSDSHTFINGMTSVDKPTSLDRLKAIVLMSRNEWLSLKWNGLWIAALLGLILSGSRAWARRLWVIPAILGGYLLSVAGVYWLNTFFEILWWISTTLNRILFALTPVMIFWVFLAIARTQSAKNLPHHRGE